tara:strand:- start:26017 stop:26274 length:258 start_codon:yes stop_codon:yes gene_type:complete
MELIMVKKKGCMPCTQFEPFAKEHALDESLDFRTVMREDMPEKIHPPYFPFFYLYQDNKIIESWGGTSEKKFLSVLKRTLKNKNS